MSRLVSERAQLATLHAQVVRNISEKDRLIEDTKAEQRTVQDELAALGAVGCEKIVDLAALGLDQAPAAIRQLAGTLLEQLRQLSAIVTAGPAAMAELVANTAVGGQGSLEPKIVLPPAAVQVSVPAVDAAWVPIPAPPPTLANIGGLGTQVAATAKDSPMAEDDEEAFGSPAASAGAGRDKSRSPVGGDASRRRLGFSQVSGSEAATLAATSAELRGANANSSETAAVAGRQSG